MWQYNSILKEQNEIINDDKYIYDYYIKDGKIYYQCKNKYGKTIINLEKDDFEQIKESFSKLDDIVQEIPEKSLSETLADCKYVLSLSYKNLNKTQRIDNLYLQQFIIGVQNSIINFQNPPQKLIYRLVKNVYKQSHINMLLQLDEDIKNFYEQNDIDLLPTNKDFLQSLILFSVLQIYKVDTTWLIEQFKKINLKNQIINPQNEITKILSEIQNQDNQDDQEEQEEQEE